MKTIFSKLILSYLAIVLIAMLSIGIFFSSLMKNYLIKQKEIELTNKGNQIVEMAGNFFSGHIDEITFSYVLNSIDAVVDSRTLVVDNSGTIVNTPNRYTGRGLADPRKGMRLSDEDMKQLLSGTKIVKTGINKLYNEPMISVAIPVYTGNRPDFAGAIILNSPVKGVNEVTSSTTAILILAGLGALLLAILAAYFLSKTLSKPIHAISDAAIEIADGDYTKKVDINRKDEIGTLAGAFNYLTEKLDVTIGALNNEKSKLSDILYSMEEGLIAIDNNLNIIHINPAVLYLLNKENTTYSILGDITDNNEILTNVNKVLSTGKSKSYEWHISDSRIVNVLISPLKYKNENIYGAIILLQDISEAAKLEKMRRDFVANVSHELRTPLTSIRGFIEPLIDGTIDNDTDRLKYHRIIREETLRLERLISDLLDLSRLQSGKITLDMQDVNIVEMISNVSNRFKPILESKNIRFNFTKPDTALHVYADGDRLEQVLVIFIDNAVKYTPEGGNIEIMLKDEGELVRISIKDSGIGIPEEDLPYIWDRFYKVDKSRSSKKSGTGLGLSIAKNIIELHNQKAFVSSKLGEGSIFEFTMKKFNQ